MFYSFAIIEKLVYLFSIKSFWRFIMWYHSELEKEMERLLREVKEVREEKKEEEEVEEGEVLLEAISRYLDLESFSSDQQIQILQGLSNITGNSGVDEAFKLAVIFIYLSESNFRLIDVSDYLSDIGY
jgi:hypothetical protein